MNTVPRIQSAATIALLIASGAAYAGPDQARDDAQAGFVEVQKNGEIATSFVGKSPRELLRGIFTGASVGKTRAQVRAELIEALRHGDVIVGDQGASLRELFSALYPSIPTGPGKTREQVRIEFGAAQQNGAIVASFAGRPERELAAGSFEQARAAEPRLFASSNPSVKTRAQVYAEFVAAKNAGELRSGEDGLDDRERFPHLYRSRAVPQDVAHGGSAGSLN